MTPQQIQELRKKYNIPSSGYGGSVSLSPNVDLQELERVWNEPVTIAPEIKVNQIPSQRFGEKVKEGVTEALGRRADIVSGARAAEAKGEQTKIETLGQTFGQGLALLGDIGMELISGALSILPEKIKDPIKKAGYEALQSPLGQAGIKALQSGMETYEEWKAESPENARIARDLEGAFNILSAIPATKGIQFGTEIVEKGIKAGVRTAQELLETAIDKTTRSGRELTKRLAQTAGQRGGNLSEKLVANINRITPSKRREFQATHGISMEKWLSDRGIIGTREQTIKELSDRFQLMRQNVDEALERIPGNYRDPRITIVADEALDFAKATESKEARRIAQLAEKARGEGLEVKEINELKRFYERNIKTGYKKDPTKTSEMVQRATNRDSELREYLFEIADKGGFTNLRQINKEIQASRFLSDEIFKAMGGQAANNLMSLTDWIVATPGLTIDPKFLIGLGAKQTAKTEVVRAAFARMLAGFPEVKPIPRADLDEITRRANEVLKRAEDIKAETQKAALLADELQKAGLTMSEGARGFIMENPIPLSRNEQALIRAAKNRAEQQQMVNYILEQRSQGKAVGKNFTIEDIDNVPILNPKTRQ